MVGELQGQPQDTSVIESITKLYTKAVVKFNQVIVLEKTLPNPAEPKNEDLSNNKPASSTASFHPIHRQRDLGEQTTHQNGIFPPKKR